VSLEVTARPGLRRKHLADVKSHKLKPGFLRQEFISAFKPEGLLSGHHCAWKFRDLAKWRMHRSIHNASQLFYLESEEKLSAKFGVEQRHPFGDRRLLEFAMAVPDFQKQKHGQRKRIILEGSKTLIPPSLQKSTNYGHFSNVFQEMLQMPFVRTIIESMEISGPGWVSQKLVAARFDRVMQKSGSTLELHTDDYRWMLPLFLAISVETWSRHAGVDLPSNASRQGLEITANVK